jgi:Planctomycete cytochrome C
MNQYFNLLILLVFVLALSYACDDTLISDIPIPDKNVSYSQHIQPIFNAHCNNSTCHNSEDRAGGISLISYGELFAVPFLVIRGAPEESQLYLAVDGRSVIIMPPPYGNSLPLSDNQITGIRTWIEEGAEAN